MSAELTIEANQQIERTLADRFRWLVFPRSLEMRYAHDTGVERIRQLRNAGAALAVAMNLFLVSDYAMVPDMFTQAVWLRVVVFTGGTLGGLMMLGRLVNVLWRELFVAQGAVVATLIHLYLCLQSQSEHAQSYLVGISMVILYANVFSRTRFWVALPLNLCLLLLYGLGLLWVPQVHWTLMIPVTLVLLATSLFTVHYLYTLEYEDRHNYLLGLRQKDLNSQLTLANDELERVSRTDALTQVANRRHFDEFLAQVWERAQPANEAVSILMLDIDHFKQYNDHYGHPAGDACLVDVAKALRDSVRRPGDLVARYGGEEFIVVLYRASVEQVQQAAERIRASVASLHIPHAGSPLYGQVTVSIGQAGARPRDRHASVHRLIQQADEALYQAKNRGRNRVWPVMTEGTA
jgi:diguanylate cyclase (GGDEF)-like protein